jgi:hypothetical protein
MNPPPVRAADFWRIEIVRENNPYRLSTISKEFLLSQQPFPGQAYMNKNVDVTDV